MNKKIFLSIIRLSVCWPFLLIATIYSMCYSLLFADHRFLVNDLKYSIKLIWWPLTKHNQWYLLQKHLNNNEHVYVEKLYLAKKEAYGVKVLARQHGEETN